MKFGIVGNNDGPLSLLQALDQTSFTPQFIGLQKTVKKKLRDKYLNETKDIVFFQGFDDQTLASSLATCRLDLLINCFCNFKFEKILNLSFPILNIHLGPLPAYRGRHPLQWGLINGETEFGFTIHKMNSEFDSGAIYWQEFVDTHEGMSVRQLRAKLLDKLTAGFADFLNNYEQGTVKPKANTDKNATYLPRRFPADSLLTEWDDSRAIYRKVMALRSESYPAFIYSGDHKIIFTGAVKGDPLQQKVSVPTIIEIKDNRIRVACTDTKTIWLTFLREKEKYLSLNQHIKPVL